MRIIDLSGYNNNNNSLIALALATSLAKSQTKIVTSQIPSYVSKIREKDISQNVPLRLRNVLASKLRNDLINAMHNDTTLQTECFHHCIQYTLYKNTDYAAGFESFIKANKKHLGDLCAKLHNLHIEPNIILVEDALNMQTIDAVELQAFMQDFVPLVTAKTISDQLVQDFIDSKYDVKHVSKLFRLSKILNIAWNKVDANTDNAFYIKRSLEEWFFNEGIELYTLAPAEHKHMLTTALSHCRRYVGGSHDIVDNAMEVHAAVAINDNFEQLYHNYVEYVYNNNTAFSYEELSCLARKWNVRLNIDSDGSKYTSRVFNTQDLEVYLLNTNKSNWRVRAENLPFEDSIVAKMGRDYYNKISAVREVNHKYKYNSEDVKLILEKRLDQMQQKTSVKNSTRYDLQMASHSKDLDGILLNNMKLLRTKEPITLIIPCQVDSVDWDDEWFSLLIEFGHDGNISKKMCISSLSVGDDLERAGAIRTSIERAKKIVNEYYNDCSWDDKSSSIELDNYSSGVHVIENLMSALVVNNNSSLGITPTALGYRHHHVKMLNALGLNDYTKKFYKDPSQYNFKEDIINVIEENLNDTYVYSRNDISALLKSRIYDIESEKPEKLVKPIYSMVAICSLNDNNDLETIIEQEKRQELGERILLIACKLEFKETNYWVGISLSFDVENNLESSILQDASGDVPQKIIDIVESKIATVYPNCILEKDACLQQSGAASMGAYIVENLVLSAQDLTTSYNPGERVLRKQDILSLRNNMPEYYYEFMARQEGTDANKALSNESVRTLYEKQSPAIDDLFMVIDAMNRNLGILFGDKKDAEATNITELKSKYHTVINTKTGNLELQINEAVAQLGLEQRLNVKYWHNNKAGMLWSYGLPAAPAVVGTVAGVVLTTTAEVTVVAAELGVVAAEVGAVAEGVTIGGVAQVGAGAIVGPIVGGVLVIISLGLMAGTYLSRRFAQTVKEAIDAYHKAPVSDLKVHEMNLEFELARVSSGRSYFSKGLRYMHISNDLHYLAILVLAQIKLKLNKIKSLDLFEEILEKSTRDVLRGMSLVGQIEILTFHPDWNLTVNNKPLIDEMRETYLNDLAKNLNDSHEDIVAKYFENTYNSYKTMFEIAVKGSFLKSDKEFESLNAEIKSIINFKDLNILKHLKPHGRIAEISFIFSQALAYVILEEHEKKNGTAQTSSDTPSEQSVFSIKAVGKLKECKSLVREFDISEGSICIHNILRSISDFTTNYMQRYNAAAKLQNNRYKEQMQEERVASVTHVEIPIQEANLEAYNAFRDSPEAGENEVRAASSFERRQLI